MGGRLLKECFQNSVTEKAFTPLGSVRRSGLDVERKRGSRAVIIRIIWRRNMSWEYIKVSL